MLQVLSQETSQVSSDLPPIQRYELLSEGTFKLILAAFPPVARMVSGLNEVDLTKGAGTIDSNSKCLWTKSKHRITIAIGGGCYSASKSNEPDPACPERITKKNYQKDADRQWLEGSHHSELDCYKGK